jgi:hypothetical protein
VEGEALAGKGADKPGGRRTFRILAINDSSDDFHAIWTVKLE